jgi:hypothetical protein
MQQMVCRITDKGIATLGTMKETNVRNSTNLPVPTDCPNCGDKLVSSILGDNRSGCLQCGWLA